MPAEVRSVFREHVAPCMKCIIVKLEKPWVNSGQTPPVLACLHSSEQIGTNLDPCADWPDEAPQLRRQSRPALQSRTSMLPLTMAPVSSPAKPAGPIVKPTTTGATTASMPCKTCASLSRSTDVCHAPWHHI